MKFKIIIFFFIIQNILFSQSIDYNTAIYYNHITNGFFIETTNKKNVSLSHIVDLRYINKLFKDNELNKMENIFQQYLEVENNLGFLPKFKIYKYIYNERKLLDKSNFVWAFNDVNEIYNKINESIKLNKFDKNLFPYSVIRGGLYYFCSEIFSNNKAKEYFENELMNKEVILGDIVKAKNGYIIPILKNHKTEIILYLFNIKNSIYNKLNDKYEISSIFYLGGLDDEISIDSYAEWEGITTEKKLIYGLTNIEVNFVKGDKCQVLIDNLRLRKEPNIVNKNIIKNLKKDLKIEIIDIGKYEIINDVGANWLKVKTIDGIIGWIFGSSLYLYYQYEEIKGL